MELSSSWPTPSEWVSHILQVLTWFTVLLGVIAAWRRIQAAEHRAVAALENAKAATRSAELVERGHVTDRFVKAVENLGHEKLAVQLGGIYTLERIAHDSKSDHWAVMEVLCAYLRTERENPVYDPAPDEVGDNLPIHIQAIVDVLKRRSFKYETDKQQINLKQTNLGRADMIEAAFRMVDFSHANLRFAKFRLASLAKASFTGANLHGANFLHADLRGAYLGGADLRHAYFTGALLTDAALYGANLTGAKTLSQDQIDSALGDDKTILPEGRQRPTYWITSKPEETTKR